MLAGAPALPFLVGAGDPSSSRLVYAMVIGLVAVGIAFVVLAVWLIRQTRYDIPVLAPLERMGDRDWRRQSDPATQRRILDEVRPEGAEPLRSESSPPSLDAEFELADRPVAPMSDLAPPVAEARSATPHGLDRPDLLDLDLQSGDSAGEDGDESLQDADPELEESVDGEAQGPVTPQGLDRPDLLDLDLQFGDSADVDGDESLQDADPGPEASVDGEEQGSTDAVER